MQRKRVLVIHYSQSGQLTRIARSFVAPLEAAAGVEVVWAELRPEEPYPFPWSFFAFMDAFPECVWLDPPPIKPVDVAAQDFDLILLFYQVWFLSPSLPVSGFLLSPEGKELLRNKPVITVIGCRNMWAVAHEKMLQLLAHAGARLLDNVVFTDPGGFSTFYTTPRWLLTGKKGKAGVSEVDIRGAGRFGQALLEALRADQEQGSAPLLRGLGAVRADPKLAISEKIGHRSFRLWGRLIRSLGPMGHWRRRPLLAIYAVFLIGMIFTAVPVTVLLKTGLHPLLKGYYNSLRQRLESPSGSGAERMATFGT